MSNMRGIRFWKNWGLVSRLMLAVGIAIITGGGVQTALLVAEGIAGSEEEFVKQINTRAKELGLTSKEVLAHLDKIGEGVKSHASTITEDVAARIKADLSGNGAATEKAPAKKTTAKKAPAKKTAKKS